MAFRGNHEEHASRLAGNNPTVLHHFMELPIGRIQAEYVWIGGNNGDLRCKTRVLEKAPSSVNDLPDWNFDGSSTNQAPGEDSEVIIKPCKMFKDPFRRGPHILVMCDAYTPQGEAIPTNHRHRAAKLFKHQPGQEPWFGIEQEYTMLHNGWPLGWPKGGFPAPQGPYYCAVGAENSFGRDIVEAHIRACLYAGVTISGINGEVMPGQWEYQVGPCTGIDSGDHLWMSRYILYRVAERFGIEVSLHPKPIKGDWNGAGCHTNFSTKAMRSKGGFKVIKDAIDALGKRHKEHIAAYGKDNHERLTGRHETASMDKFSWGVANRGASIRVGRETEAKGYGYLEDRRPASNMDPYIVTGMIYETTVVNNPGAPKA